VTPRCDRCAALPIRSGPHPPHDLIAEDGVLDDLDLAVNVNAAIEIGKPPVEDNALALRWSGVDFETGTVSIDGTVSIGDDGSQLRATTKTKKSRRIGVSSITLAYLRAHKDRLEELLSTAAGEPVEVEPDPLVFSGGRAAAAMFSTPAHGALTRRAAGSGSSRTEPVSAPASTCTDCATR
jgi:hypothetical protein